MEMEGLEAVDMVVYGCGSGGRVTERLIGICPSLEVDVWA